MRTTEHVWPQVVMWLVACDGLEPGSADDGAGSGGDQDSDQVSSIPRQEASEHSTRETSCHQDTGRMARIYSPQRGSAYEVFDEVFEVIWGPSYLGNY